MQQIKTNLKELNETKFMLIEEITGKMIQRADFLSQIESLEIKQTQLKTQKSKDIEFFFEERDLKEKLRDLEREIGEMESEATMQAGEIKKSEAKLKIINERKKYILLEIDLKNKEKAKKFMIVIKEKSTLESDLEECLKEIGASEVYPILLNTAKILLENIDDFSEQQIRELLSFEKLLEDLQRFFEEKNIEKIIQEAISEHIQNFYRLLMNYGIFRKKLNFHKYCILFRFHKKF